MTKIQVVLISALILGSGVGGSLFWWYIQPKAFSNVSGLVHLDEPIVGASISVYDLDGVKVFEKENVTDTIGSFVVNIGWGSGKWSGEIPDEFTIVATGGTVGDESFMGSIVRVIQNHIDAQYYNLNAITTLIAAYMDKHPEVTYGEASEALKDFLGVPEFVDMDLVVDSAAYYRGIFDHAFFMFQAEEHADFDMFIEMLLDEFEMGKQRVFSAAGGLWEFSKPLLSKVGGDILGTVTFMGTSALIGATMRAFGYQDTDVKIDLIIEKLDDVLDAVDRIEQGIQTIEDELIEIERAIDELQEMEIAKTLVEYVETIETTFQLFNSIVRSGQESVDKDDLERLRNSILDPNQGVIKAMNVIYDLFKGHEPSFQKPGILEVITGNIINQVPSYEAQIFDDPKLHDGLHTYIVSRDRSELDSYLHTLYDKFLDYYQTLENYFSIYIFTQIKGLLLIKEAYNYHNQTGMAQDYINMFLSKLEAQMDTFLQCVDTLVFNLHPFPMAEFPNMGAWSNPPYTPDRAAVAQIYQRADYLVDKILASAYNQESGGFKARVLLSMLEPAVERTWGQYRNWMNAPLEWFRTTTRSIIGGEPKVEFAPAEIAMNDYYDNLAFQYLGDQPWPSISVLPTSKYPNYTPVTYEYRSVTVYANAPSRWALPKAVLDYGTPKIYNAKDMVEVPGQMEHTVPYGQDGTVHYVLFDFGRLPSGYYRLLTGQTADHVNEGTGWVMDYARIHNYYVLEDPNWQNSWSEQILWPHRGTDDSWESWQNPEKGEKCSEAVIYIGFQQGPNPSKEFAVINPLNYHLHDGYAYSRQGYIHVSNDENGDPYGYWGGYWRQSDYVETVEKNPTDDAWLNELYPNENFGGDNKLEIRSHGKNARSILTFDLTDLPENVVVESATLTLNCLDSALPAHYASGRDYHCQTILTRDWIEGTKSGGIQSGSSCWNYAQHKDVEWKEPGGDMIAAGGSSAKVPGLWWWGWENGKTMTWDVKIQVQFGIDKTGKEVHFIIMDSHEGSSTNYFVRFASRETIMKGRTPHVLDYSAMPKLEITYRILPPEGQNIVQH